MTCFVVIIVAFFPPFFFHYFLLLLLMIGGCLFVLFYALGVFYSIALIYIVIYNTRLYRDKVTKKATAYTGVSHNNVRSLNVLLMKQPGLPRDDCLPSLIDPAGTRCLVYHGGHGFIFGSIF